MITPISKDQETQLLYVDDLKVTIMVLANKINEIIKHLNCGMNFGSRPDIDEQIEKNKCNHPDCLICNECDEPMKPAGDICKAHLTMDEFTDVAYKALKDKSLGRKVDDRIIKIKHEQLHADDYTDKKYEEKKYTCERCGWESDELKDLDYNLKLWTRDMRKMIKGKNISPKLKDDIRRKLNELEEI
jgi:hypothetical protein